MLFLIVLFCEFKFPHLSFAFARSQEVDLI